MIHVDRVRVTDTGVRVEPSATWFTSAANLTALLVADGAISSKRADAVERVYSHNEIKLALPELFDDKCAYCELKITGGFRWDVEHFRPKKRVNGRSDHAGYYWLACEWTNLFPSCQFCNQRASDIGVFDHPEGGPTGGKLDQFPVSDEQFRAMDHTMSVADENAVRLLVDPCADDPEDHVVFDLTGHAVAVAGSARGQPSIDVYHLNRTDRRERRKAHIDAMLTDIRVFGAHVPVADRAKFVEAYLARRSEPGQEFAGVARAMRKDPAAFGL